MEGTVRPERRLAAMAAGACAWLLAATASANGIDAASSWVGFTMKTRWGQALHGRFPVFEGEIADAGAGRRRVYLRLSARDVEIVGHPRYGELTRGEGFFEADRHPVVEFVSDAWPPTLLYRGGKLAGTLIIRGVSRREVFTVEPAACDRPGVDCDIFARGTVYRGDFGMDRWSFALSDRVQMTLRLRIDGE